MTRLDGPSRVRLKANGAPFVSKNVVGFDVLVSGVSAGSVVSVAEAVGCGVGDEVCGDGATGWQATMKSTIASRVAVATGGTSAGTRNMNLTDSRADALASTLWMGIGRWTAMLSTSS